MFVVKILCLLLLVLHSVFAENIGDHARQKRCIVVQKQSGTHGDSSEDGGGDDDDYRAPQNKDPRPNHMTRPDPDKTNGDFEEFTPQLLKYRLLPVRKDLESLGLKTKLPWLGQRKPWIKRGNINKNILSQTY